MINGYVCGLGDSADKYHSAIIDRRYWRAGIKAILNASIARAIRRIGRPVAVGHFRLNRLLPYNGLSRWSAGANQHRGQANHSQNLAFGCPTKRPRGRRR